MDEIEITNKLTNMINKLPYIVSGTFDSLDSAMLFLDRKIGLGEQDENGTITKASSLGSDTKLVHVAGRVVILYYYTNYSTTTDRSSWESGVLMALETKSTVNSNEEGNSYYRLLPSTYSPVYGAFSDQNLINQYTPNWANKEVWLYAPENDSCRLYSEDEDGNTTWSYVTKPQIFICESTGEYWVVSEETSNNETLYVARSLNKALAYLYKLESKFNSKILELKNDLINEINGTETELLSKIGEINTELTSIKSRISTLEESIESILLLVGDIENISNKIDELEERLDNIDDGGGSSGSVSTLVEIAFAPQTDAGNKPLKPTATTIENNNDNWEVQWTEQDEEEYKWKTSNSFDAGIVVYMSTASFNLQTKEIIGTWSEPICLGGSPGVDTTSAQYIYARTADDTVEPNFPATTINRASLFESVQSNESDGVKYYPNESDTSVYTEWFNHPQGIDKDHKAEWIAGRFYDTETEKFKTYTDPVLWSRWGTDGTDGDGVEYIFKATSTEDTPNKPNPTDWSENSLSDVFDYIVNLDDFYPGDEWFSTTNKAIVESHFPDSSWDSVKTGIKSFYGANWGWTDDPVSLSETNRYIWVSIRKYSGSEKKWGEFGDPKLWSKLTEGNGIDSSQTKEYYKAFASISPTDFYVNANGSPTAIDSNEEGVEDWKTSASNTDWSESKKYLFNIEKIHYTLTGDTYTSPQLISVYPTEGKAGKGRNIIAYTSTNGTAAPSRPEGGSFDVDTWTITWPTDPDGIYTWGDSNELEGERVWQSNCDFGNDGQPLRAWTTPFCITGEKGDNGADGVNVEFVYMTLRNKTKFEEYEGTKTSGVLKETLEQRNYTKNNTSYSYTYKDFIPYNESWTVDGYSYNRWTDHPTGISETDKVEICMSRKKDSEGNWGDWDGPVLWASWGEDGIDGDGLEYIFAITQTYSKDAITTTLPKSTDAALSEHWDDAEIWDYIREQNLTNSYSPWTDDPSDVSPDEPYEWVSIRRGTWDADEEHLTFGPFDEPKLWARWSSDGRSVVDIKDYYIKYSDAGDLPETLYSPDSETVIPTTGTTEGVDYWTTDASKVTVDSSNPYLWNIEKITYKESDSSFTYSYTSPVVIGVYGMGENGQDSIYADLDNQMETIAIDEETLMPTDNYEFTTTVGMWRGSEAIHLKASSDPSSDTTDSVEISGEDGITVSQTQDDDRVKLTFSIPKTSTAFTTIQNREITIICNELNTNGTVKNARKVTFNILAVPLDVIYSFGFDSGYIRKDTSGSYSPETLNLHIYRKEAKKVKEKINIAEAISDNKFHIHYYIDAATTKSEISSSDKTGFTYSDDKKTISINPSIFSSIKFDLVVDGGNGVSDDGDDIIIDTETVLVLSDGGEQGIAGAIVRGPIAFDPTENRSYYNGKTEDEDTGLCFLDIATYGGKYYQCVTSYTRSESINTNVDITTSDYWEEADASYSFVATDLLLSTNAKIKFLTGNEIYMTDPDDVLAAGITGGNVSFYAGVNDTSDLTKSNFSVTKAGLLTAKNAVIKGAITATSLTLDGATIDAGSISGLSEAVDSNVSTSLTGKLADYVKEADIDTLLNEKGYITSEELDLGNYALKSEIQIVGAPETTTENGVTKTTMTIGDNTYTWEAAKAGEDYMMFGTSKGSGSAPEDGSGTYFVVSTDGLLQANNAVIKGKILASEGYFTGEIKSGSTITCGNKFKVISDGTLTATGATISGAITATSGEFGPLHLTSNGLDLYNGTTFKNTLIDTSGNFILPSGTSISWSNVTDKSEITEAIYEAQDTADAANTRATSAEEAASSNNSALKALQGKLNSLENQTDNKFSTIITENSITSGTIAAGALYATDGTNVTSIDSSEFKITNTDNNAWIGIKVKKYDENDVASQGGSRDYVNKVVPVLYLHYENKDYIMNPGSWIDESTEPTVLYWLDAGDLDIFDYDSALEILAEDKAAIIDNGGETQYNLRNSGSGPLATAYNLGYINDDDYVIDIAEYSGYYCKGGDEFITHLGGITQDHFHKTVASSSSYSSYNDIYSNETITTMSYTSSTWNSSEVEALGFGGTEGGKYTLTTNTSNATSGNFTVTEWKNGKPNTTKTLVNVVLHTETFEYSGMTVNLYRWTCSDISTPSGYSSFVSYSF